MSRVIKNALFSPLIRYHCNGVRSCSVPNQLGINSPRNFSHFTVGCFEKTSLHHDLRINNISVSAVHTKGSQVFSKSSGLADRSSSDDYTEKELAAFLTEEIKAEKKLQKVKDIPMELDGFKVHLDGSEVVLTKQGSGETVEVSFNINHTVDTESEPEVDPASSQGDAAEMKSRPNFEVEIRKGDKTLGFTCSMVPPTSTADAQEDVYNDLFAIDEVVMYSGDWKETNYSVSGDVLDGTLYDMFMDMLEDKGIGNEFIEKITKLSTSYEHSCYITMLEDIQKFCSGK